MRLTLRTLLAYMDDILEPEDAEQISRKIEESEFATNLLHRARDVMRRLRLGTPDVSDRGLGLDPNTVAEYLDNSLAPDRVLDFEKICLESDAHLAEVACCHQILALVLGEPAEVDPASRQRMYQLPDLTAVRVKAANAAEAPAATPAAELRPEAVHAGPQPATRASQVKSPAPGWLRQESAKRRGWWPTAAAVSLAVIGVILGLALTGQFEPGSFLANLFAFGRPGQGVRQELDPTLGQEQSTQDSPGDLAGRTEAGPSEVNGAPESAPERPTLAFPPGVTDQIDRPGQPMVQSEPAVPRESESALGGEQAPVEPRPDAMVTTEPRSVPPAVPDVVDPGAVSEPGVQPASPPPAGDTTPPLTQPPVAEVADDVREAATRPEPEGPPGDQPEVQPGTQAPTTSAPLPPEVVGQFDSPLQVLLAFDADTITWQRVRHQAPLMSQTSYLSLPTYRPMLRLADQTQVLLADGTQIELLHADPEGVLGLGVAFGRLVIESPDRAKSRLRLQIGDRSGVITFEDAGSRLAVEVKRASHSGADPETQPGLLRVDLYATSGKSLWKELAGSAPVAVTAPARLTLNEQPLEAVEVQRFPNWIVVSTISPLDQQASGTVQRELQLGRSAVLGLRELADHRRREVRWLALRCLDYLGDFEPMVAALDDPEQKMRWGDYVDKLRAAVVRSPSTARQVRTAMEKLHGIEGAGLYEMLWSYNDDALDGEDAARLIEYLDHDTLAFRVVSFQILKRITKLGLYYRPEDTAMRRRPWVAKWKERLKSTMGLGDQVEGGQQAPSQAEDPSVEGLLPGVQDQTPPLQDRRS